MAHFWRLYCSVLIAISNTVLRFDCQTCQGASRDRGPYQPVPAKHLDSVFGSFGSSRLKHYWRYGFSFESHPALTTVESTCRYRTYLCVSDLYPRIIDEQMNLSSCEPHEIAMWEKCPKIIFDDQSLIGAACEPSVLIVPPLRGSKFPSLTATSWQLVQTTAGPTGPESRLFHSSTES